MKKMMRMKRIKLVHTLMLQLHLFLLIGKTMVCVRFPSRLTVALTSLHVLPCISEFTAGEVVHTVIGFTSDAESELIVTGIEASFR